MKSRPVTLDDRGWRKHLPANVYLAIHGWSFKGATRLRRQLGLQPRDVEKLVSAYACAFTRPDSTFLDVGAQHGRHVRAVLESGPITANVVAFEANPSLALKFKDNFAEAIASSRLRVVNAAVADEPGTAEFFVNTFDSGYSGLVRRNIAETRDAYSQCTVARISIDGFSRDLEKKVSCIKIDVEGAEFAVLKGAERTLSESQPIVLFECASNAAPFYGHGLPEVVLWLNERGFAIATIDGQRISRDEAQGLFDSRSCCDFVAYPEERGFAVVEQLKRHGRVT